MNIFKSIMRFVLCNFYYKVEYIGEDKIDYSKPHIFAANHITWVDGIFLWSKTENMSVMAKKELFRVPLVAQFFKAQGAFPVSRNKKDIGSMYHALNIVRQDPPRTLMIFPEGTRHAAKKGVEAKTGTVYIAARTNVDIVPIYIQEKRRPFGRIKIIYGEPIKIEIPRNQIKNKLLLREATDKLMDTIYSMRDQV